MGHTPLRHGACSSLNKMERSEREATQKVLKLAVRDSGYYRAPWHTRLPHPVLKPADLKPLWEQSPSTRLPLTSQRSSGEGLWLWTSRWDSRQFCHWLVTDLGLACNLSDPYFPIQKNEDTLLIHSPLVNITAGKTSGVFCTTPAGDFGGKESACQCKSLKDTWVWSLGWEDLWEKGMSPHSRILAWKTSRAEESGGLQSRGSQRVRHDWAYIHTYN